MGNWTEALVDAETVLDMDKTYLKGMLAKAESLYSTCDFEHALIFYFRGLVSL